MVAALAVGGVLLAVMIAMCVVLGFQVGALVLAAGAGTTLRSD